MAQPVASCQQQVVQRIMQDFDEGDLVTSKVEPVLTRPQALRIAHRKAKELCRDVQKIAEAYRLKTRPKDREDSMRRLAALLQKEDVTHILDRVDLTTYSSSKHYWHQYVFPLFQMLSSVAYQEDPVKEARKLFPGLVKLDRRLHKASLLPHKGRVYCERINIGAQGTPQAVLLYVLNGRHCDVIITVRGSREKKDFLINLLFQPRDLILMDVNSLHNILHHRTDPQVHSGFHAYHIELFAALMPRLLHTMSLLPKYTTKNYRFFLAGHSLGALTSALAIALGNAFRGRVFAFTYGAPFLGNKVFNDMLMHPDIGVQKHYRIYNNKDYVPWLRLIKHYLHPDELLRMRGVKGGSYRGIDCQALTAKAAREHFQNLPWKKRLWFWHSHLSYDGVNMYVM